MDRNINKVDKDYIEELYTERQVQVLWVLRACTCNTPVVVKAVLHIGGEEM